MSKQLMRWQLESVDFVQDESSKRKMEKRKRKMTRINYDINTTEQRGKMEKERV